MYLAEIHGKISRENENKEDILTSNVFSFFKYSDRKTFLLQLLRKWNLNVSEREAEKAEFTFWPAYDDGTEPDLLILVGQYYLLIEAKYRSGFGKETEKHQPQLVREVNQGKTNAEKQGMVFRYITITADRYKRPEQYGDFPKEFDRFLIWCNWQSITLLIFQQLESTPPLAGPLRLFAQDFYTLLLRKNLRNYEGLTIFRDTKRIQKVPPVIYFQLNSAKFRYYFIGYREPLQNVKKINPINKPIFFNV